MSSKNPHPSLRELLRALGDFQIVVRRYSGGDTILGRSDGTGPIYVLGHVALWTSFVILIANAESDSAAVGLLGTAGAIGGLIAASTGKARSRRAYRHLFNAVNAYNEQWRPPFPTATYGDQPENSPLSEHEEGSFPPGAP